MKQTTPHFARLKTSLALLSLLALLSSSAHAEQIRLVNLTSPAERLSLWVDGREVRSGIAANTASSFVGVGAGRQNLVIFSERGTPRPFTLDTRVGKRYTLVLGGGDVPRITPFEEDGVAATPQGQVGLRAYSLSRSSVSLGLQTGPALLGPLAFGQSARALIPRNTENSTLRSFGSSVELSFLKTRYDRDASLFVLEREQGGGLSSPFLIRIND